MPAPSKSLVSALLFASVTVACAKPEAPSVTPKEVQVTAVGTDGISLGLKAEMHNPNSFGLTVTRVTGKVKLASGTELAEVTVVRSIALPAKQSTLVDVPIKINWNGAAAAAKEALSGKDLPFTLEGKVGVGSERLSVDVPYTISGIVTQQQMKDGLMKTFGNMPFLQGLPL
jgi:LEA14-like dessication related protein